MPFADLQEFFDPTLRLPIRGKVYVVQSPNAATGLWCQRLLVTGTSAAAGVEITESDFAALELDDGQEQELYKRVLGPVFDELDADEVPWEMIKHAGTTAFMWVAGGRDAAESFWSTSPGEAQGPTSPSVSGKKKSAPRASRASQNPKKSTEPETDSPTSS